MSEPNFVDNSIVDLGQMRLARRVKRDVFLPRNTSATKVLQRVVCASLVIVLCCLATASFGASTELRLSKLAGKSRKLTASSYFYEVPAKSVGGGSLVYQPCNIDSEQWYEIVLNYKQHDAEVKELNNIALLKVTFLDSSGKVLSLEKVKGLNVNASGMIYKYIPSTYYTARSKKNITTGTFHVTFKAPVLASKLLIQIRSWNNRENISIGTVKLVSVPRLPVSSSEVRNDDVFSHLKKLTSNDIRLIRDPHWISEKVEPNYRYLLMGELASPTSKANQALVRVRFRDGNGQILPGPYPGITTSAKVGPYIYLPTQRKKITIQFSAPPNVASVDLGFQTWGIPKGNLAFTGLGLSPLRGPDVKVLYKDSGLGLNGSRSHTGFSEGENAVYWLNYLKDNYASRSSSIDELFEFQSSTSLAPVNGKRFKLEGAQLSALKLGTLQLENFDAFRLPTELKWTEDPFKSVSWRQTYQSLYWLLGLVFSDDESEWKRFEDILDSWLGQNSPFSSKDRYAYDDHGIAIRAEFVIEVFKRFPNLLKEKPVLGAKLIALAMECGLMLEELLDHPAFTSHNHGLFHAHALLNLSLAFPSAPFSAFWKDKAIGKLESLTDRLFTSEGFSIEQTASYHYLVMNILSSLYFSLRDSEAIPNRLQYKIKEKLVHANTAALMMTHHDGSLLRLGDSEDYAQGRDEAKALLRKVLSSKGEQQRLQAIFSKTMGEGVSLFPKSGYAVFRSSSSPAVESYLFIDYSPQSFSHGHFDATSFEYTINNTKWLVDSGGPYSYGSTFSRGYLLSSRAHNLTIPNNYEQSNGESVVLTSRSVGKYYLLDIQSNVYGAQYHYVRRFLIRQDLQGIAVVDYFWSEKKRNSLVGSLHFNIASTFLDKTGSEVVLQCQDKKLLVRAPESMGDITCLSKGQGAYGFDLQGFISRRPVSMEAAPTLLYRTSGSEMSINKILIGTEKKILEGLEYELGLLPAPSVGV